MNTLRSILKKWWLDASHPIRAIPIVRRAVSSCGNRSAILILLMIGGLARTPQLEAAGVFNGASYLVANESVVNDGSDPDYGILMACWFKRSSTTGGNRVFLSITNNAASTSRRSFSFSHNDAVIQAQTFDGNSSPANTSNSYSADGWYPAFAWFGATDNREAKLSSGSWATNGVDRPNVTGLSHTAFGTLWVNSGPNTVFSYSGKLAEVGVWAGIDSTTRDLIVDEYDDGVRPPNIAAGASSLVLYQSLRAGVNEFDKVGPDFTNSSVTFDPTDHPPVIYTARQLHHFRQR